MRAKSQKNLSRLVLKVAVSVPVYRLFDYLAPDNLDVNRLTPGLRLEVPFGNGHKVGFLIEIAQDSDLADTKLKSINKILDDAPLISPQDLKFLRWASDYYHYPLGEVMACAYPPALRQVKNVLPAAERYYALTEAGQNLEAGQLNRSPKQQALLLFFQSHPSSSIGEPELNRIGFNWRVVLKAMVNKGFIQLSDASTRQKPLPPTYMAKSDLLTYPEPAGEQPLFLNIEQQTAVDSITCSLQKFNVFLLEGVTGSGKTEVYMQIIRQVLKCGQQAMVLLPEISLTPQIEKRFRQRFAVGLEISHSGLTGKRRTTAWFNMQQGASAILLGTRSALFTPLKNPGLIILDEEHDSSYKQQEGFRFSARDAAIMRAKQLNIPVVLGSATPSLESLHNATQQRYRHLVLPERAGNAAKPAMHLLDIRNKTMKHGLSEVLLVEISKVLDNGEQALIFFNRRGFAPTLICHDCGWVARCRHCDANLVIHQGIQQLRCHHCDREQRLFQVCPACGAKELVALGQGTERIENTLNELFPDKVLVRLDRDTTQRKGALERFLTQINAGEADIILGTQMLAKGHHFPNVTLVAIIDVDSGLFSIDFRAAERLAQLIIQVAGRAGRAEKPGRVLLQTRHPEHPLLNTLTHGSYGEFARIASAERKQARLPPYSHQALFHAHAENTGAPLVFLRELANFAKTYQDADAQILGPVAAPMAKRAGAYRYQLLLQSPSRSNLQRLLTLMVSHLEVNKTAKTLRWSLDVDPIELW